MKTGKSAVSALLLAGAIGFGGTPAHSAVNVISQERLADGSYCHTKFEAIRESTLDSAQPTLKDVDDIVDFYGPCNHDPLGKEEIQQQKIEAQHRFASSFDD
jgi:hypothetical protein